MNTHNICYLSKLGHQPQKVDNTVEHTCLGTFSVTGLARLEAIFISATATIQELLARLTLMVEVPLIKI